MGLEEQLINEDELTIISSTDDFRKIEHKLYSDPHQFSEKISV